MELLIPCLF